MEAGRSAIFACEHLFDRILALPQNLSESIPPALPRLRRQSRTNRLAPSSQPTYSPAAIHQHTTPPPADPSAPRLRRQPRRNRLSAAGVRSPPPKIARYGAKPHPPAEISSIRAILRLADLQRLRDCPAQRLGRVGQDA
jgi:hypothetical protein